MLENLGYTLCNVVASNDPPVYNTLQYVTNEISTVVDTFIDVMEAIVVNPFFAFLFACGFVRIMMSLIKKAKKTSR